MSIKALEQHLIPLMPFILSEGVTEICINQPGQVFVEKQGKFTCYRVAELNYELLVALATLIAEFNHHDYPAPLLSGSLPTGERVQIVSHPACEKNKIIYSIRRHQRRDRSLDDYVAEGTFDSVQTACAMPATHDHQLQTLYEQHDIFNFLKLAIHQKKNILISGSTGTGKTTFLNACLKWIPEQERLITIEDTREVFVRYPNVVHLLFNDKNKQCTALQLFTACLRLRPDRILLSELRGAEVWPYLRAASSGHPGSLSTIHADSPDSALTQLVWMMQQAGSTASDEQLRAYIQSTIPIVIQLKRDPNPNRFTTVSDVYFSGIQKSKKI